MVVVVINRGLGWLGLGLISLVSLVCAFFTIVTIS